MPDISTNLLHIRNQIIAAEMKYGRQPGSVQLLAVSKTQPVAMIKEALLAKQYAFGENYLQEALTKITELPDSEIEWHFIGTIQRNKTKAIAENFSWVHTIDDIQHAQRLDKQRPQELPVLNVCIQVNADAQESKSGVSLAELPKLAFALADLKHLKLRGLMTIPAPELDFTKQRHAFRVVREAFEDLQRQGLTLDTLSMGMSHDFQAAIAEGATIVRIGTAIFGARKP